MKASEVLQQALELLGPRGQYWGQKHYDFCGRYCVQGAIWQTDAANPKAEEALLAVIRHHSLEIWNDDPERTFEDVQLAFERAIKHCQKQEAA